MSSQPISNVSTCDYCHQKPKFPNYNFCGKTCAATWATNCDNCHLKPKFPNFAFCSKKCAGLANTSGSKPSARPVKIQNVKPTNTNLPTFTVPTGNQSAAASIIPIITKLAQQVPQVQAFLATLSPPVTLPTSQTAAPLVPVSNNVANATKSYSKNNPFASPPSPATSNTSKTSIGECLLPGCTKLAYTNTNGAKTGDYCSMRHREEAVAAGSVEPCIMCLMLPQSDLDHFCSKACKDEAMSKPQQVRAT